MKFRRFHFRETGKFGNLLKKKSLLMGISESDVIRFLIDRGLEMDGLDTRIQLETLSIVRLLGSKEGMELLKKDQLLNKAKDNTKAILANINNKKNKQ